MCSIPKPKTKRSSPRTKINLLAANHGRLWPVVEEQVQLNGALGSLCVEPVMMQHVLGAQHAQVGANGHLAQTVRVEVQLILGDVLEVLR